MSFLGPLLIPSSLRNKWILGSGHNICYNCIQMVFSYNIQTLQISSWYKKWKHITTSKPVEIHDPTGKKRSGNGESNWKDAVRFLFRRYPHRGKYRESNALFFVCLGIWVNVSQRRYDIFSMNGTIVGPNFESRNLISLTREWITCDFWRDKVKWLWNFLEF